MMEHPIQQPNMGMGTNTVLSNELIEKASRLMNTNPKGDVMNESRTKRQVQSQPSQPTSSLSAQQIKDIVRETMEEVLSENGLLVESESKSGEMFKFRVGQHLFEGKVLKVKKMVK
jgi:CRISPR/Cas system-associated protein Cas7 (RAMP superfamily)